ncbi:MAG: hypothetical protein K2R93_13915 [Gemmatimonadaceae bacterium]|nr:hypothetical protein [Gemmatimonadaceae bacterium]
MSGVTIAPALTLVTPTATRLSLLHCHKRAPARARAAQQALLKEPSPGRRGTRVMPRAGLPLRHARDAFAIYAGVRLVLSVAVSVVHLDRVEGRPWLGVSTVLWSVGVSLLLSEVDLRRAGAPELLANLGIGQRERLLIAALPMLVAETILHAAGAWWW